MIVDPWFWALALPAVALTGVSKGGMGGGAVVATPLMALAIPPTQAAAIMLRIVVPAGIAGRLIYALLFVTGSKLLYDGVTGL